MGVAAAGACSGNGQSATTGDRTGGGDRLESPSDPLFVARVASEAPRNLVTLAARAPPLETEASAAGSSTAPLPGARGAVPQKRRSGELGGMPPEGLQPLSGSSSG